MDGWDGGTREKYVNTYFSSSGYGSIIFGLVGFTCMFGFYERCLHREDEGGESCRLVRLVGANHSG